MAEYVRVVGTNNIAPSSAALRNFALAIISLHTGRALVNIYPSLYAPMQD
jgi:hypothetical protein